MLVVIRTDSLVGDYPRIPFVPVEALDQEISPMPIERAARALVHSESGHDDWDCLGADLQDELCANVCATFAAVREATPKMLLAGQNCLRRQLGCSVSQDDLQKAVRRNERLTPCRI